jgi:hypothetical protein
VTCCEVAAEVNQYATLIFIQATGVKKVWKNLSHLVSNKKALPFLARRIPLVAYRSYLPDFTPNPCMTQKWNVTMVVAYHGTVKLIPYFRNWNCFCPDISGWRGGGDGVIVELM